MSVSNGDETIAGEDAYEVVSNDEPSLADYPTPPHPGSAVWNMDEETWDEFIARTRKPPKVVDGVYDTRRKR